MNDWRSEWLGMGLLIVLAAGCRMPGDRAARISNTGSAVAIERAGEVQLNDEAAAPPQDSFEEDETAPNRIALVSDEVSQSVPPAPADSGEAVGKRFQPLPPLPPQPDALTAESVELGEGTPLTLPQLETLACQYNPTLLQAQQQVQGELGKAIQAGLWPNPRLNYVQEQIGVGGTPGEFVGGAVSQRIVTAHKLDLSRQKYLARTQAAEWHALEQQYRVLNDVRLHYFRARGQRELLEIQHDLLRNAEDHALTTREQYNVGQATRAAVRQANVALQRARLALLMTENNYRQAFQTLMVIAGVAMPDAKLATPLESELTPMDYQSALTRLLSESPQLQAARSKLHSDLITIERERAEPIPDLVVGAAVGRNFEAEETVAAAQVGIEVPLFDRNQGTIQQAQADYRRQQGEVRRLELALQQRLAQIYRDYLTALQHAQNFADSILPEARSAYELQLRSYKDDRIPWTDVLATQHEYFSLRAEYVRHLIAWREAEVLLTGYLLHDGLMAPTGTGPAGHINSVPKPR